MLKTIFKRVVLTAAFLGSTSVFATTYNFDGINIDQENLSGQLFVDVTDGGGTVLFKITNSVGIASNVAEIYFDTDTSTDTDRFFSNISILSESGTNFGAVTAVDFSNGASPPNLPGGGITTDFAFDNYSNNTAGLNEQADFIILSGTLLAGSTYLDVINALNNNVFEIGLHVRSIGTRDGSDSYIVGNPSAVPLPAAGWLFGSALLGLMGLRRKLL